MLALKETSEKRKERAYELGNKGSAILPALVAAIFVIIAVHQASGSLLRLQQTNSQEKLKVQWKNLEQRIQILFWDPALCQANLLDTQNAAKAALKGAVDGGPTAVRNIRINYPGSNTPLAGPNMTFENLAITTVTVRETKALSANGYLAKLRIQTNPPAGSNVVIRPLDIPVYLTTDATGIASCYFSSYSSNDVTVDDHLCTVTTGMNAKWDPGAKRCL